MLQQKKVECSWPSNVTTYAATYYHKMFHKFLCCDLCHNIWGQNASNCVMPQHMLWHAWTYSHIDEVFDFEILKVCKKRKMIYYLIPDEVQIQRRLEENIQRYHKNNWKDILRNKFIVYLKIIVARVWGIQ